MKGESIMSNPCNTNHTYGPFRKVNNETITRTCICCNHTQTYPLTQEINNEITLQNDTAQIMEILIHNPSKITDANSLITLTGILYDGINHMYIEQDTHTQQKLIERLSFLSNYFKEPLQDNQQIIKNFIELLKKTFEKNNLKIKGKELDEEAIDLLDLLYETVGQQLDTYLTKLYDTKLEQAHAK